METYESVSEFRVVENPGDTNQRLFMKPNLLLSHCASCPLNRRNFLARGGAATGGALGLFSGSDWLTAAEAGRKTRIRIV